MAITGFLEKVVVSDARSGHDTPMQPGRRFELLAVVLLLTVGVGMPVAAHTADAPALTNQPVGSQPAVGPDGFAHIRDHGTTAVDAGDIDAGDTAVGGGLTESGAPAIR